MEIFHDAFEASSRDQICGENVQYDLSDLGLLFKPDNQMVIWKIVLPVT